MVLKQSKWTILRLFLLCYSTCWQRQKICNFGMHLLIWTFINWFVQTLYDDRYYRILCFDTSVVRLDLNSRTQECMKPNTSEPIFSQNLVSVWMKVGMLLKLSGLVNLVLMILSCSINIQGRDPYLCDFVKTKQNKTKKTFTIGLYSDIYRLITF